jgi:capsule polysaccharide export protein KpsE/RkpR
MSDQYTTEARFAVMGGASASSDPISRLTGLNGFQETQDAMIVVNYLKSPAIVAELDHAAKGSKVEGTAPQMQLLRVKIEVISNQISDLERLITATADARSAPTISDKMTSFDQLETNHKIAEKQYTATLQTFERARVNAESKKVYLTAFVPPLLPHDVSWPQNRLLITLLGAAAVAAIYWPG